MVNTIQIDVVSAEESILSEEAEFVVAPAKMGEVGIYPNHASMITLLKAGSVRIKKINKSDEDNVGGEIIHKGISQRQFARSFTIADDVKVNGAELKDGLLTISCERIIPEHKKKKLIEIK